MRIGHTGLNSTLYKIGNSQLLNAYTVLNKKQLSMCYHCRKYNNERRHVIQSLKKVKHHDFNLSGLLGKTASKLCDAIITFVKESTLYKII